MYQKLFSLFHKAKGYLILVAVLLTASTHYSQIYNDLPESFPDIDIEINNHPEAGCYFMSGSYFSSPSQTFTMIIDTTGMPVYFQKQDARVVDFKKQKNGLISYYKGVLYDPESNFVVIDSNYNPKYFCAAINGFITDPHELIIQEDNSYWILGLDIRAYDMSQIVTGGDPEATVKGNVIQHISSSGQLLFEWNSWDHIDITDCDTRFVDLTSSSIDYVHANALDIDYDGNILMSSRHLNEITKINIATGEIMWRMGGNKNQFTFEPSDECFFGQHSIRYCQETDTYILFDNGNWHNPKVSRGVEYNIDEENMKVTRISKFTHDPDIYSSAQGGVQRLENENTIVNWSSNSDKLIFTEFDNDNTIYELACQDTAFVCYRVHKYNWANTLFEIEDESLEFLNVTVGDSAIKSLTIINNQDYPLIINGYNSTDAYFDLVTELPVTIESNSNIDIEIVFKPVENTDYKSLFSLFHSTDTSRIAQQIIIRGHTITGILSDINNSNPYLIVYPNPCSTSITVAMSDNTTIQKVNIIDIYGSVVLSEANINNKSTLDLSDMTSGVYTIFVSGDENKSYTRRKLIVSACQ